MCMNWRFIHSYASNLRKLLNEGRVKLGQAHAQYWDILGIEVHDIMLRVEL